MSTFTLNTDTKKFDSKTRPEVYAKQVWDLVVVFPTGTALNANDNFYFVADNDYNITTDPVVPRVYATGTAIDSEARTVTFHLNTNSARYPATVLCAGTKLKAEIRKWNETNEAWDPVLLDTILANPTVIDPDAPTPDPETANYVQSLNDLQGYVNIVDENGDGLAVDSETNSVVVSTGNYTAGNGITLTGKEIAIDTEVTATLEDITAHNKSATAHNDIRVELAGKANTSDVTTALGNKVDKVEEKGLSSNDYSNTDKSKVDALGSMATKDAADYRTAADQDLIDDGKVSANAAITGATKAKITYDSKGLVTAGADLEESDIPSIPASKVTGLTTVATSGNYSDLINKPLDSETVPMSITGYATEGYPVARLDDVYDSVEIYKNAVGLAVVEMTVRSADNTITGNIVLIPVVNGVDGDPVTVAVTASWAKVSFALSIPAGTLAFRRDHASASDTLKDGASVVTAQVIEIAYRSTVL